ncbi:MAG TPA: LysM peptidoglycan-binding domain-containing protein, partial [Anaerolineae bacterium]|nr:LysM peptidoglycan-binding domain-containing protein [Anaerolineae bacterium]
MAIQNLQVNLDDTTFKIASDRAAGAGKTLGQVVAEFLIQYADGASGSITTTYTIQRGDTLGRIAQRFYGDARKYPVIQRANNISNPSRIWIGQVLVIPALGNGGSPQPTPGLSPVATPPLPIPSPAPLPAPLPPAPVQPV